MKIELSIKTTYLPGWGAYEGIRELLQNGQDAKNEFDAPLDVHLRKETATLVITNEGCTLPVEALLLGHTSKVGRPDLIGKFGEGLKLGILALVRAGHAVKIRSGSEVWVPSIQRSEKFTADVLVFDITKGHKPSNRVAVEVGGVDEEVWASIKDCFLFLDPMPESECIRTPSGSLLLASRFAGKVFVKGIFVSNDPRLSYGYDLQDADLDRDRKMVAHYDLQYRTATIWREALVRHPELMTDFSKLLEREAADIEGVDQYNAMTFEDHVQQTLANDFIRRHGQDAIPVQSLGESQDVEHLGKKGVVVPKSLRAMLEQRLGTVEGNKAKLRNEVTASFGWHDLTAEEKANVERAIELVNGVEQITINEVDIVSFRDDKIRGMFKDSRALLARKIISDRDLCLRVLVHEVAHRTGGDGEKSHVANIERIWSGIIAHLTDKAN